MFTRTRYQSGSLQLKRRAHGPATWEYRYYETGTGGKRQRRTVFVGSGEEYPSESAARKSPVVQAILLRANTQHPASGGQPQTFGAVLAQYEEEEMPERYSTRSAYQSVIDNHLRPRWADVPLNAIKPLEVERWLKQLPLAPKTRLNVRNLMHTIFECALRWELAERHPVALARVKGGTKRTKIITVLTPEQFNGILAHLAEPYRTMVLVAGCLGLRVSEIMGLQWGDFDFDKLAVVVQRGVVHGRVDEVKTEYSHDEMPLDPILAEALQEHQKRCAPTEEGWVFPNPRTGKPYHQEQIQNLHLRNGARKAGVAGRVGWHTFRHSYRSWLDEAGAPLSVQKELMRHADIQTTMNVYGRVLTDTKRDAQGKVVQMLRGPRAARQDTPNEEPQQEALGFDSAIGS